MRKLSSRSVRDQHQDVQTVKSGSRNQAIKGCNSLKRTLFSFYLLCEWLLLSPANCSQLSIQTVSIHSFQSLTVHLPSSFYFPSLLKLLFDFLCGESFSFNLPPTATAFKFLNYSSVSSTVVLFTYFRHLKEVVFKSIVNDDSSFKQPFSCHFFLHVALIVYIAQGMLTCKEAEKMLFWCLFFVLNYHFSSTTTVCFLIWSSKICLCESIKFYLKKQHYHHHPRSFYRWFTLAIVVRPAVFSAFRAVFSNVGSCLSSQWREN